jgi:hypothetical protein
VSSQPQQPAQPATSTTIKAEKKTREVLGEYYYVEKFLLHGDVITKMA